MDASFAVTANLEVGRPKRTANLEVGRPTRTANLEIGRPIVTANLEVGKPIITADLEIGRPDTHFRPGDGGVNETFTALYWHTYRKWA